MNTKIFKRHSNSRPSLRSGTTRSEPLHDRAAIVNLPRYFSIWKGEEFIHQVDIGSEWSDEQIWDYAIGNNLIIITKDSDFSHRMILRTPPPEVIHIRFGNLKMRDFFAVLSSQWSTILSLIELNKFLYVYADRIEAVQ